MQRGDAGRAEATRRARGRRKAVIGRVGVAGAMAAGAVLIAPTAARANDTVYTNCDGNAYVAEVEVQDFSLGQFEIQATPTSNARYAQLNGYGREATNEIWHAVQACVPGLYGELADGIYQQIECHVLGGLSGPLNAGGATYDFESWRVPTSWDVAIATQCNWGGWPYLAVGSPYRTDRLGNNPTF